MEDNIRGRTEADAELSGRQKGEREPLMLPAAEERKMLPAGEERKLLPSGESDEKTMMAAFEGNTGQNQPIGVDAEIPAGVKAGEATFIEGAKDKTAEEIAGAVAQESGIGVTTSAEAGSNDIINKKVDMDESGEFKLTKYQKKKYARPSGFRKGVRNKAWEEAKTAEGVVLDPLTQKIIDPNQPWDMGHKPGYEFRKHQQSAAKRGISRAQFLEEYNDFRHYRPELPSSNRSHRGEDKTAKYLGY